MKEIPETIPKGLKEADTFFLVNDNDRDLKPIAVPLPVAPPFYDVDGWDLPIKEQYFRHQKIPRRLRKIGEDLATLDEMWEYLDSHKNDFTDEITWLRLQIQRFKDGYWFYNHGKPTYITNVHYFYMNFYPIDVAKKEYRDRMRRRFLFIKWAQDYHFDFADQLYDEKGNRLPNKPGDTLNDVLRRTCIGVIEPKMRRAGTTHESLCQLYFDTVHSLEKHFGIQSISDEHAKRAYKKLTSSFRKILWCFLPQHKSQYESLLEFKVVNPGVGKNPGLESKIDYATTSSVYHYDGSKLFRFLFDECGKVTREDLYAGWDVIRTTMLQGGKMSGFCLLPSTAGEFEKEGGEAFFRLVMDSNYYERTGNGTTKSGMFVLFFPAYDGLEGFIDKYGESVIDTPTPEQAAFIGRSIGAKEYLENERKYYLSIGTPEAMQKYRERQRLFPMCLRECFISDGQNIGFNTEILEQRISELRFMRNVTVRGNFSWANGKDSSVVFKESPEGRWVVSAQLRDGQDNRKFFSDGMWFPMDRRRFMHAADPFAFDVVQTHKMSQGGIITIERWNREKDPIDKPIIQWTTPRIVCTYLFRPADTDEFAEDCLMQAVYYGGMMNPECNFDIVRKHFIRRGYGGYLYYMHDTDGYYKKVPGYQLKNQSDKLLSLISDFIERHGRQCNHIEILEQCLNLRGKQDITNKDLVAVLGGALLGIDDDYTPEVQDNVMDGDISSIVNFYRR